MRLPNGYGSVYKLSGKRRNPFIARKTVGWTAEGVQEYITIGYYPTRQAALQALADYNQNPYDIKASVTFREVFEKWSDKKFQKIGLSNIHGYNASYKLCHSLYDMQFSDIKLSHLQAVVDNSEANYPSLKKLKTLFNQLFDFAVKNSIINKDKHIVDYLDIGKETKSTLHYRFSDSEVETLWRWSKNNEYVMLILMMIYSGVRPGELFNTKKCDVNLDEKWFNIRKGKNDNAIRKVPIHDRAFPFFEHWMKKDTEYLLTQLNGKRFNFATNHSQYTDVYWSPLLQDMGILNYQNEKGETCQHLPDDTRHTFTTMWKEKQLDEAMRRRIQGHSGKGIGEQVYTHFELEKLRTELNRL